MEGSETPNGVVSEYGGTNEVKENGKVADDVKMEPDTEAKANGTGVDAAAPSMLTGGASNSELQDMKPKHLETNGNGKQNKNGQTHRIDIDNAMTRFQRKLGRNWDRYRDAITHFLMGKLTRPELTAVLGSFLTPLEVRTHNYLLLAILANSFREPPPGDDGGLSGWKARGTTRKTNVDTPTELLHREIMALPARERKRIKNIARDNKRPNVPVPLPCLIATRQAMLPHLPYVQDRRTQPNTRPGSSPLDARSQPGSAPMSPQMPRQVVQKADPKSKMQKAQDSPPKPGTRGKIPGRADFSTPPPESEIVGADGNVLNPGRISGPLTWTQDIIHGFEAPLAGEIYELPDDDSISERVLGIALEHGITNGYEAGVTDVLLAGVEQYLTTILSSLVSLTTNRTLSPTDPLTADDFQKMFIQTPGRFREFYGPLYRISTHYLRDEETATTADLEPIDNIKAEDPKPSFWSLDRLPQGKRTAEQASLLENSNKGKQFVRQLLDFTRPSI